MPDPESAMRLMIDVVAVVVVYNFVRWICFLSRQRSSGGCFLLLFDSDAATAVAMAAVKKFDPVERSQQLYCTYVPDRDWRWSRILHLPAEETS